MGATARASVGSRRQWLEDAAIAVGFGIVAFVLRLRVPADGFFFDDAWQTFAVLHGSFSELFTIGQTQPGFGAELLVWRRVFGAGEFRLIGPALLAGTLGPPALYLVLRAFRFARTIAVLLAAALTVSATHVVYSSRVKAYTTEVLLILVLALVVPRLARLRWRATTALGWFVGSVLVASFSSFTLLASSAAGLVLVLHAKDDRRARLVAVGAQALAILALLAATERTHNGPLLRQHFEGSDGYVSVDLNPLAFVADIGRHFARVADTFPGGPAWVPVLAIVAAMVGLIATARRRGARAIAARFMLTMVLLALVGSLAGRVPFGPTEVSRRATLWLVPVVAFGLAAGLDQVRRVAEARGIGARRAFDGAAIVLAGLLLITPIGAHRPYPPAARDATRLVMDRRHPGEVVLICRFSMYSFALYADTPVRLQSRPDRMEGLMPEFADDQIVPVDSMSEARQRDVAAAVAPADVVYVVDTHTGLAPAGYEYHRSLVNLLSRHGFRLADRTDAQRAGVYTWVRTDEPEAG